MGIEPKIVEYLKQPPGVTQLKRLAAMLGMPLAGLLRKGESEFVDADDLPPLDDEVALAAWLQRHPVVLQRPIVVDEASGRAIIGRPPDNVATLIGP